MVASVVKNPTMVRVTVLCGRVLSGRIRSSKDSLSVVVVYVFLLSVGSKGGRQKRLRHSLLFCLVIFW